MAVERCPFCRHEWFGDPTSSCPKCYEEQEGLRTLTTKEEIASLRSRAERAEGAMSFHAICYPKMLVNKLTKSEGLVHDPNAGCRMVLLDLALAIAKGDSK